MSSLRQFISLRLSPRSASAGEERRVAAAQKTREDIFRIRWKKLGRVLWKGTYRVLTNSAAR